MKPYTGRATASVSHSWLYEFATLFAILEDYAEGQVEEVYFYLDIFGIN